MPTAHLIAQQLAESPAGLVGRIDAYLVSQGAIGLQQVLVTRRSDAPGPRFTVSLVFTVPGTISLRAMCFTGTPTSPAVIQATAFLAANPTYRGHFVRDLGDQRRGGLNTDVVMLLYAANSQSNCGYDRSKMIVARATADILAGDTGTAVRITPTGDQETITVVNLSTQTWLLDAFGYAFPKAGDCTWEGVPTCCGSPVTTTTTTAAGCPDGVSDSTTINVASGGNESFGPFALKPDGANAGCCYSITLEGALSWDNSNGVVVVTLSNVEFKPACDVGGGSWQFSAEKPPDSSPLILTGTKYVCDYGGFYINILNFTGGALTGGISWTIALSDPTGCP